MKTCAHIEALILCGFTMKKIKSELSTIIEIIRVRQNSNTFRAIEKKKEDKKKAPRCSLNNTASDLHKSTQNKLEKLPFEFRPHTEFLALRLTSGITRVWAA